MAENRHPEREPGVRRRGYTFLVALVFFACLSGLPAILSALHLKINAAPPTSSDGIKLLGAPQAPQAIALPPVARPISPAQPTATFPPVSESQEAAAVAKEDNRLRTMLHDSFRTFQFKIIPYRRSLPTLVLTSGSHYVYAAGFRYLVTGKSTYTAADLISNGAMVRLPHGGALLEDNVFVSSGTRLELSSSDVSAIYLDNTPGGSASIVAWGGSLDFRGTRQNPLTLQGWDEAAMTPARDTGNGRPYIREVAGQMTFENARVSALGFWSGRTGGVAWTGLSSHPSFGAAISTTFSGNTYGAFVTRGRNIRFSADLFEANQLDGLHIHRGTVGAWATFSAAVRNGANGFHVDRATQRTVLLDDLSQHNATNGFLVDGRPLVSTASASGNAVAPGSGTRIENSAALDNGRTGILIEGGNRTVLKADEVCARLTGIALRYGASNAIVDANDVRCGPRTGIRIGPLAPGALVFGNAVSGARIAVVVTSPGGNVEIDKSLITLARVFGISVRGVNSVVSGKDNVISGIGFSGVDSRAGATKPALSGSNTANWAYARKGTVLTYLEFHPLALLWLSIAFLVIAGGLWVRRRRPSPHPYPHSTRWRDPADDPGPAPLPVGTSAGAPAGPVPAGSQIGVALAAAEVGPVLAGTQAGLAAAGERVGLSAAGKRVGPPWFLDHDAWADGGAPQRGPFEPDGVAPHRGPFEPDGVAPHRGPFEPALPDGARVDAPPLDGGRLDGGAPGSRRLDGGRLDPTPLDGLRLDGGRLDGTRLDGGRLDPQRPDAERYDPEQHDPTRLEDARPYVAQSDGQRQLSRHSRSEPIDSTKPLPQVGDRQ